MHCKVHINTVGPF